MYTKPLSFYQLDQRLYHLQTLAINYHESTVWQSSTLEFRLHISSCILSLTLLLSLLLPLIWQHMHVNLCYFM